jgi:hypothetical protein
VGLQEIYAHATRGRAPENFILRRINEPWPGPENVDAVDTSSYDRAILRSKRQVVAPH